ncbi:MAG: TonB-dependent receptor, partial [Myxococcales bacterium]
MLARIGLGLLLFRAARNTLMCRNNGSSRLGGRRHPLQSQTSSRGRQTTLSRCCALLFVFCLTLLTRSVHAETAPLEVVVQGNEPALRRLTRDPSLPGTVITRERLTAPGLQTQELLRSQPGIFVTETGGVAAPATATIRGASAADMPVYLGGVRLNDEVGGSADLSMVPLWLIQRVEIYRGHAPIEADRLGTAGAIFFDPRVPNHPQAGVGSSAGSWGTNHAWAYAGSKTGAFGYLFGINGLHATNRYPYRDDAGMTMSGGASRTQARENADVSRVDAWMLSRYEFGRGAHVDFIANVADREQGVPKLALLPSRMARQRTSRRLAALDLRIPFGGRFLLHAQTSVLRGQEHYSDPLNELSLRATSLDVTGTRVEESIDATFDVWREVRIKPMLTLASDALDRAPAEVPLAHSRRNSLRAAMQLDAPLTSWFVLRALGGHECHVTASSNRSCNETYTTGRVGAELIAESWHWYANLGRYVRIPTLGELNGISGTVHGNRELVAETGVSADVGTRAELVLRGALQRLYLDVFAFARFAEQLIAYTRTGQAFIRPYNVGQARVLGAESLLGARIGSWLRLETAITLLDPRDRSATRTTSNDLLPYRSRWLVSPRLQIDWKRGSIDSISSAGAEVSGVYQSNRYVDRAGLALIDAQTSVDTNLYVGWFEELLHLRFRVTDLLNQKRTDIVGFPLPGRSFYLGMDATF